MTAQPTLKGAWKITFLLFLFMLVNFADKIVVNLAGVPIKAELQLSPEQFGFLGSSFFFLFSISAIVVGFIVNRVDTRWVLLAMAVVWALAQFPMVGTVSFTTLVICRIILGAGEGPAFAVAAHAVYKWFPDEKRTLPTAILSQGSAFGVILAVPALNWIIVNHSWHYAFGALGVVGLMWVAAWLVMGKEGPLVQTAAMDAADPRVPYFQLLTSRTFIGCCAAAFGAYWALSLGLTWFTSFIIEGLGFSQKDAGLITVLPWVFGAVVVLLAGWISQVMLTPRLHHPRRPRRARLGAVDRRRRDPGGPAACQRRRLAGRVSGVRLRAVRIDLCGLSADARRVHAGAAARRRDRDLRRGLYAGGHHRAAGDGQHDPARGGAVRRLHDRLHHQRRRDGRIRTARPAAAVAQHRARAPAGAGGAAEIRVTTWPATSSIASAPPATPTSSRSI